MIKKHNHKTDQERKQLNSISTYKVYNRFYLFLILMQDNNHSFKKCHFRTKYDKSGIYWISDAGILRLAGHPQILMKKYIEEWVKHIDEKSIESMIKNLTVILNSLQEAKTDEQKEKIKIKYALAEYESVLRMLEKVWNSWLSPFVFYPSYIKHGKTIQ